MTRKKKKGSTRKHPLVFVESPVEVSRRFPSPVFAARNPVTANLVSVTQKQHLWLSPQIDPNAPYTPAKRRGARRNKAACSLNPLTQTYGHKEIARKDKPNPYTSLKFINGSAGKSYPSTDLPESVHEKEVEQTAAGEQGSSVGCGIATRTRAKQKHIDNSHCEHADPLCLCKLTLGSGDSGSDKENRLENDLRRESRKFVSLQEQKDCLLSDDDKPSCSDLDAVSEIRKRSRRRALRKHFAVMTTRNENPSDSHPCHSTSWREDATPIGRMHQSWKFQSAETHQEASKSTLHVQSEEPINNQTRGKQRHRRARRKSGKDVKVLAVDTPEADYGIRVSLRRRCKLLQTPARNKLMGI